MPVGYARVSKADGTQLPDMQRDALLGAGVDQERVHEVRASGRHDHRPGLDDCLKALQPSNTFVVWKLDRLGRDLKHLVPTAEELHDRGIGMRVLAGADMDTTTANGRLVSGIFAALAKFERELIAELTLAGLAGARARGRLGITNTTPYMYVNDDGLIPWVFKPSSTCYPRGALDTMNDKTDCTMDHSYA